MANENRSKAGAAGLCFSYRRTSTQNLRVNVRCAWIAHILRWIGFRELPAVETLPAVSEAPTSDR